MPQVGEPSAASTARTAKPAVPPVCMYGVRMSWVVGQNDGRIHEPCSPDTSARYSATSSLVFRQVKYVYDWWKPTRARLSIIAGRVNASDRNTTSGWAARTSASSHCQNDSGLVCGLS